MKMNDNCIEELLPIVARLTEKYTSKESTSITYEKARQLMGAVTYCINEWRMSAYKNDIVLKSKKTNIEETYEKGYQMVLKKVNDVREKYNELVPVFKAYGNENYKVTFLDGISAFFLYYDPKFFPQNHIITMDYPLLKMSENLSGIDAIECYLEGFCVEQRFLHKISEEDIYIILKKYVSDYEDHFFNICGVIVRSILGCILVKKRMEDSNSHLYYEKLQKLCLSTNREKLRDMLQEYLHQLILGKYDGDKEMYDYLSNILDDYSVELIQGSLNGGLEHVVIL